MAECGQWVVDGLTTLDPAVWLVGYGGGLLSFQFPGCLARARLPRSLRTVPHCATGPATSIPWSEYRLPHILRQATFFYVPRPLHGPRR